MQHIRWLPQEAEVTRVDGDWQCTASLQWSAQRQPFRAIPDGSSAPTASISPYDIAIDAGDAIYVTGGFNDGIGGTVDFYTARLCPS